MHELMHEWAAAWLRALFFPLARAFERPAVDVEIDPHFIECEAGCGRLRFRLYRCVCHDEACRNFPENPCDCGASERNMGTVTGRLSTSRPTFKELDREPRECEICPDECAYEFADLDYADLEERLAVEMVLTRGPAANAGEGLNP